MMRGRIVGVEFDRPRNICSARSYCRSARSNPAEDVHASARFGSNSSAVLAALSASGKSRVPLARRRRLSAVAACPPGPPKPVQTSDRARSPSEECSRHRQAPALVRVGHPLLAELVRLPRFEVLCRHHLRPCLFARSQRRLERTSDGGGKLGLNGEDVRRDQLAVVALRPQVSIRRRIDELDV